MLLVNDELPGPTIRANVGDTIQIKWVNESPDVGVSIHYHGLRMKDQPYSDGTGGANSCVVGPMQTFFHTFVADNAGTHYWVGQTSLNRMDGLQGAIIIEDPSDPEEQALKEQYDAARIIFLQDWYHRSGSSIRTGLDSEPFIWLGDAQSFLINGKGRYEGCVSNPNAALCDPDCTAEKYLSSVSVEAGKTYLFRIINAASLVAVNLAIAKHSMTVVRADGTYVEPLILPNLDVNVGQRYSVLIDTAQKPNTSYWISATIRHGRGVQGQAYLQYGDAMPPSNVLDMPTHIGQDDTEAGPSLDASLRSKNVDNLPNSNILDGSTTVDRSIVVATTESRYEVDNQLRWTVNNVSNSILTATPVITMAYQAVNDEDEAAWPDTDIRTTIVVPDMPSLQDDGLSAQHSQQGIAVYKFVQGDVIDLVLQNTGTFDGAAQLQSWHLHGHAVYVIGQGMGYFDMETDPMNFNLDNPLLRDTVSVWPSGWTAVRFVADNVGAWPFQSAMAPYQVMGLGVNIITSPDRLPPPPPGLVSCFQTSTDPNDSQVCDRISETSSPTIVTTPSPTQSPVSPTSPPTSGGTHQERGWLQIVSILAFWASVSWCEI